MPSVSNVLSRATLLGEHYNYHIEFNAAAIVTTGNNAFQHHSLIKRQGRRTRLSQNLDFMSFYRTEQRIRYSSHCIRQFREIYNYTNNYRRVSPIQINFLLINALNCL